MKKHIIAAAVAAAVTVPAMAQNVSLYGRLDAGYNSLDAAGTTTATYANLIGQSAGKQQGIAYGVDQTALWGMRGSEDLGGGMRANFVIETGLGGGNAAFQTIGAFALTAAASGNTTGQSGSPSTNAVGAQVGNRLLYAGLQLSPDTEVRIGYQSSLPRDVYVGYAADSATNVVGNIVGYLYGTRHNAATVFQNVGKIRFGAAVTQQAFNVGGVETNLGSGYAAMARYDDGPFSAAVSYMANKNGVNNATSNSDRKSTVAGASYDFKTAKVFAQYINFGNEINNTEGIVTGWNLGISAPFGATSVFASLSRGSNRASTGATEFDVKGYNVGARYNLSKRTNVYAIAGSLESKSAVPAKIEQFGAGVTHSF